jgi:hypothetical protein
MKILLISYDFYPEEKPNTYRWFNVAKKWIKDGAEIYVISANKNQFSAFEKIDGINIYRTTEFLAGSLKYQFRHSFNSNSVIKNKGQVNKVKSFFKNLIRKIYDLTWSNLYWPDHSFLWRFSAVPLAIHLVKTHNIDKVITVSWTFSAHIIGYQLKKRFENLYWLADTIDPFSFNPKVNNSFLYSKLNNCYEYKIFNKADLNIVLTNKIKEKYSSLFPDAKHKIKVNNNVFIPIEFDYKKLERDGDEKIRVLFLGTLSSATRSPKNLLLLINNFVKKFPSINIQIDFYGDFTDTDANFRNYSQLLNKHIFLNGFINRQQVNEAIKNADVLLNIGNNNEYQEPSKLIEYMYSGKKILNICNIVQDTSAELLKIYPIHLNVLPTELEDDLVLEKLFNFLKNRDTINKNTLKDILKNYLLDEVADKYLNFLLNKQATIY